MGMDGLTRANTGALNESTSADLNSRTEQIIQTDKNIQERIKINSLDI